jgi:hypothetical protein
MKKSSLLPLTLNMFVLFFFFGQSASALTKGWYKTGPESKLTISALVSQETTQSGPITVIEFYADHSPQKKRSIRYQFIKDGQQGLFEFGHFQIAFADGPNPVRAVRYQEGFSMKPAPPLVITLEGPTNIVLYHTNETRWVNHQ